MSGRGNEKESESYLNRFGVGTSGAWQEGKAPIVRFHTDDDKIVGMMFGAIQKTFEDCVLQVLVVSGAAGVIVIRGPGVATYHNKLAQGLADMVKANGKEVTSVLYYPPMGPKEEEDPDDVEKYA